MNVSRVREFNGIELWQRCACIQTKVQSFHSHVSSINIHSFYVDFPNSAGQTFSLALSLQNDTVLNVKSIKRRKNRLPPLSSLSIMYAMFKGMPFNFSVSFPQEWRISENRWVIHTFTDFFRSKRTFHQHSISCFDSFYYLTIRVNLNTNIFPRQWFSYLLLLPLRMGE